MVNKHQLVVSFIAKRCNNQTASPRASCHSTRALVFVRSAVTAPGVDISDHHVCYMSLTKQLSVNQNVLSCCVSHYWKWEIIYVTRWSGPGIHSQNVVSEHAKFTAMLVSSQCRSIDTARSMRIWRRAGVLIVTF